MYQYGTLLGLAAMLARGGGGGESTPAARVLDVKGTATIIDREDFDRPVAIYGTIYGGERIVVGEGLAGDDGISRAKGRSSGSSRPVLSRSLRTAASRGTA